MTVGLSPHKVNKILRGYFGGLTQTQIAKEVGVDQSSVSHYVSRFKKSAVDDGILAAGRRYQVLNEVETLRSISVELSQSKLTVEDAKRGHNIIRAFQKLGFSPDKHLSLIKVCRRIEDPIFIENALELARIEKQFGMSRDEAISSFEEAVKQLPQLEIKITEAKCELENINNSILKKKRELAEKEKHLGKYENDIKYKIARLDKKLSSEMTKFNVQKKEIKMVKNLKEELGKQGLDLETLIKLGEEFSHDNIQV